jgi:transposase-like protein
MIHGYIYCLLDPRTFELRYIGQTTKQPHHRVSAHLCPSMLRKHSYLARWLKSLVDKRLKPLIAVLDVAYDQSELDASEVAHIAKYREGGFRLVNLSDGGGGRAGYITPPEMRAKIRLGNLGKPHPKHTSEWKLRMSVLMAGRSTNPPEHYERLAEMKRGVPRSEETKIKISEAKTGQPGTFTGHEHTKETKAKISEGRTGQLLKEEHFAYRHDITTAEILRLLEGGMSKVQIAAHFEVSPTFVHRRLKEAKRDGLSVPSKKFDVPMDVVLRRLSEGATVQAVASELSMPYMTVWRRLRAQQQT